MTTITLSILTPSDAASIINPNGARDLTRPHDQLQGPKYFQTSSYGQH